ncbi:unnamed protein product [Arabidopsis halleri]
MCEGLMAWRQQMEMPPTEYISRFQSLDQQIQIVDDVLDDALVQVISPLDLILLRVYMKVLGWRKNLLIHYCFSPMTLLDLHDEDTYRVSIIFESHHPWSLFKYDFDRILHNIIESALAMMARLLSKVGANLSRTCLPDTRRFE